MLMRHVSALQSSVKKAQMPTKPQTKLQRDPKKTQVPETADGPLHPSSATGTQGLQLLFNQNDFYNQFKHFLPVIVSDVS